MWAAPRRGHNVGEATPFQLRASSGERLTEPLAAALAATGERVLGSEWALGCAHGIASPTMLVSAAPAGPPASPCTPPVCRGSSGREPRGPCNSDSWEYRKVVIMYEESAHLEQLSCMARGKNFNLKEPQTLGRV